MATTKAVTIKELPPEVKAAARACAIVFCSFFTKKYEADAAELKRSLVALSLPYIVVNKSFPDTTWQQRANDKIRFTLDVMEHLENRNKGVCWIDCDGVLVRRPDLLISVADEAYYEIAFRRTQGGRMRIGLLYFLNTDRVRALMGRAADWLDANPTHNEAEALDRELALAPAIRALPLPPEYEVIPGRTHLENPMHNDPVFLHRLKHTIGDNRK
jgi:hypothetical protein